MAIKTVIFQSDESDNTMSRLASEAAIASNLSHVNVVAMYSHDICTVSSDAHNELDIYKFYLIQVRPCGDICLLFRDLPAAWPGLSDSRACCFSELVRHQPRVLRCGSRGRAMLGPAD